MDRTVIDVLIRNEHQQLNTSACRLGDSVAVILGIAKELYAHARGI
jgi:hypothetical protein